MLLSLLLLLQAGAPDSARVYVGRSGQLDVRIPRIEADATIDGALDEPAWARRGAPYRLLPVLAERWRAGRRHAPRCWCGIRRPPSTSGSGRIESHGAADRHAGRSRPDRRRRQRADSPRHLPRRAAGARCSPSTRSACRATARSSRGANTGAADSSAAPWSGASRPDLSPDYVFQSKGRRDEWGYQVEVRIPFKSLRYQPAREQSWDLNIVRQVKHSGFEDTWAPARRASASFLGQSGTLEGLTELRSRPRAGHQSRGHAQGRPGRRARTAASTTRGGPQFGGNVRWGITNNLTLNGTVKPDFSAGGVGRGAVRVRSAAGALLRREAAVLPRRAELFQCPTT